MCPGLASLRISPHELFVSLRTSFLVFPMLTLATNISRLRHRHRGHRKLPFPATPSQRIAQISAVSKPFDLAQPFSRDRWNELEAFRPRVLVGSTSDLQRLYCRVQAGGFDLSSLDHAVFVLTRCGLSPLSDVLRVSLWQAFGVPLFELFISSRGRLLASECEAHEGWHVEPGTKFSLVQAKLLLDVPLSKGVETGLTAEFDQTPCPCGREGLRLMKIDAHAAWAVQKELAASA